MTRDKRTRRQRAGPRPHAPTAPPTSAAPGIGNPPARWADFLDVLAEDEVLQLNYVRAVGWRGTVPVCERCGNEVPVGPAPFATISGSFAWDRLKHKWPAQAQRRVNDRIFGQASLALHRWMDAPADADLAELDGILDCFLKCRRFAASPVGTRRPPLDLRPLAYGVDVLVERYDWSAANAIPCVSYWARTELKWDVTAARAMRALTAAWTERNGKKELC